MQMQAKRLLGMHVFCSVKGGVGKSTLAVVCGHLLAEAGSTCVVIDADLTGTSLADGLRLRAPILRKREDGTLDLNAEPEKPGELFTADETRLLRLERGNPPDDKPRGIPFFNDILLNINEDDIAHVGRVKAALWSSGSQKSKRGNLFYLPSSPTRRDVAMALGWLYHADNPLLWLRRVAWIIDGLVNQMPELRDIVVDLPPGLAGFSHEIMLLVSSLASKNAMPSDYPNWEEIDWRVNPFLVMSQDSSDLFASLEYFQEFSSFVAGLKPVVNRKTEGIDSISKRVRERFAGMPVFDGVDAQLASVDNLPLTLGRLFIDETLHMDDEVLRLKNSLRLME